MKGKLRRSVPNTKRRGALLAPATHPHGKARDGGGFGVDCVVQVCAAAFNKVESVSKRNLSKG